MVTLVQLMQRILDKEEHELWRAFGALFNMLLYQANYNPFSRIFVSASYIVCVRGTTGRLTS